MSLIHSSDTSDHCQCLPSLVLTQPSSLFALIAVLLPMWSFSIRLIIFACAFGPSVSISKRISFALVICSFGLPEDEVEELKISSAVLAVSSTYSIPSCVMLKITALPVGARLLFCTAIILSSGLSLSVLAMSKQLLAAPTTSIEPRLR